MTTDAKRIYSTGSERPQDATPALSPTEASCHPAAGKASEAPAETHHATAHQHGHQGRLASAWHFVRHLLEMCLAMCVGWALLGALYLAVSRQLGHPSPYSEFPVLSVLVAAANMTIPMAAWMRFRGMEWLPIGEMSAAMFVEAILLIGAAWLGVISGGSLADWLHRLMMPAMLVPMFLRLDLYTGRSGHHMHAGPVTP